MPTAAPRSCTFTGCGVLVATGSRCPAHAVREGTFSDRRRGTRHERGYGTEWDKKRERIMERDCGICQPCKAAGLLHVGTEVDHRVPRAEGGTEDDDNLQTICHDAHVRKTREEALRARQRRQVAQAGGVAHA